MKRETICKYSTYTQNKTYEASPAPPRHAPCCIFLLPDSIIFFQPGLVIVNIQVKLLCIAVANPKLDVDDATLNTS